MWYIADEVLKAGQDAKKMNKTDNISESALIDLLYAKRRLLSALQMAYRKHHCGDDSIGWNELSDVMCDSLCEVMGDEGFQRWVDSI